MFVHKQSVEFDYIRREVILRKFMRFGCLCRPMLVREQRLHFDCIDSFKYDQFAYTKSGPIHEVNYDQFGKPEWENPGGYVILVAVKRSLGEATDGFLSQASSGCCCSPAAPSQRLYSWPAFIRRAVFDGGDLLVLDYNCSGRDWNTADDLDADKVSVCMGAGSSVRSPGIAGSSRRDTVATCLSASEAREKLLPIVNRLNSCLTRPLSAS